MSLVLFHRTDLASANAIMRDGFPDGKVTYMTTGHSGVWLSDQPLVVKEDDVLLRVNLQCPEGAIVDYEWLEDGKSYREWLIPASLIKAHCTMIEIVV